MIKAIIHPDGRELTMEELRDRVVSQLPAHPMCAVYDALHRLESRLVYPEKPDPYSIHTHRMWGITFEHPKQACGSCGWLNVIGTPACAGCGAVF